MNGKSILVTGGAGFIGSHLCESLLKSGFGVVCIDNFNDFYSPDLKKQNIKSVMKCAEKEKKECTILPIDVRNKDDLEFVFSSSEIAMVVHLAAMAGVRPSIADPNLYYETNVMGTLNVFEMCRLYNVGKVVFGSSSSVYGGRFNVPFKEDEDTDHTISPYAATKKAGEVLAHTYHHLYNIDVIALRFFTVYGPRQRPDLAIRKFAENILAGKSIPVYGDGSAQRDYTYIDDIIQGITGAIKYLQENKKVYEAINLGESETNNLKSLIFLLEKYLGANAIIDRQPAQPGDVPVTCADIFKAQKMLGYNPGTPLESGIRKFVEWLK